MTTINHGLPTHDFFTIAQPPSVAGPTVKQLDPDYEKPVIQLRDPKATSQIIKAELHDVWVFELKEVEAMNSFSHLAYGIPANKLVKVLCRRYPEVEQKQKVHFLLLKKLS